MARCHLVAAAAAALILCLAGQASAQFNSTIGFFDVTPVTVYGQAPTFRIALPTPLGTPAPAAGNALFQNATNTPLISFALTSATLNPVCTLTSCGNIFSFTGFTSGPLPAGVYNQVGAAYTGGNSNGLTYTPVSSRGQGLPDTSFQVLPAATEFTTAFTPFTLANFSSAISVNLTNLNKTSIVPAGVAYAAFYKDPAGANTLIGNYSLVFTPVDANTVKLTFPSNFDATTLFKTPGPYRLIETYFPTPNFTQPTPLIIGFTVSAVTPSPPPPPPPTGVPVPAPPPPPTTGGLKTTISLSIFFNYARRRLLDYGGCNRSGSLTFVTAVQGPSSSQVPPDGTVTIALQPGNVQIGSAPLVVNAAAGVATATITRPFIDGATYGYGSHTATATYSGSTNGAYLPAQVTVSFVIPSDCNKAIGKRDIVNHVIDAVHDIIGYDSHQSTSESGCGYAASAGTFTLGK